MSTLTHPPIARFVEALRDRFDIRALVETGTFTGESTLWAAERFREVITIDNSLEFREAASARCAEHANVTFLAGDTRVVFPPVVAELERPALLWLDAHGAPGLFGDHDDWPVLHELAAINYSAHWLDLRHFVLIDDAHCFLPGTPHPACPTLEAVEEMAGIGGYSCWVAHDVIAVMPEKLADGLRAIF
jgi:hypothetical protein